MTHEETVRTYWQAAEARDWDAFAETLGDGVVYSLPQTRERVVGRESYVAFNREYPGDWHLSVTQVVADERGAASMLAFEVGDESMTGIAFFTFDTDGRIATVTDFWPEPYDPPPDREHLTERW